MKMPSNRIGFIGFGGGGDGVGTKRNEKQKRMLVETKLY